jgi:hypothetical protein
MRKQVVLCNKKLLNRPKIVNVLRYRSTPSHVLARLVFLPLLFGWSEPAVTNAPVESPMHQLRMRPLKPFWGWTKTTSSLPKYIYSFPPLLCPKTFFSYLSTSPLLPPISYLRLSSLECQSWSGNAKAEAGAGAGTPELELERQSWSRTHFQASR